jgi:hypothetical protein
MVFTSLLARRLYGVCVALSLGFGSMVLWGGATRFSGPAWEGPRRVGAFIHHEGDAWVTFGMAFLLYGLALLLILAWRRHARQLVIWCLRLGWVIYLGLATSFLWSLREIPTAAGTGVTAYTCIALLHVFLADDVAHPAAICSEVGKP